MVLHLDSRAFGHAADNSPMTRQLPPIFAYQVFGFEWIRNGKWWQ